MVDAAKAAELEVLLISLRGYAMVLCSLELSQFDDLLEELEREETLMPLIDPTTYREIAGNMREHKVMVRALRDCRATLETLRPPK